jgi:hypothetical protein
VFVTAGTGNLVAIERAGIERKDFGSYLFGEIDVHALETAESPIAPYDSSRSLTLNPAHPIVAVLVGFIGASLETVRSKLVAASREARKNEEARRLAQEADRIAEILNKDFATVRDRLDEIRAAGLYEKVWQSFAVLLPIKTVGVMGDERSYENVIALRVVESQDGMTANWVALAPDLLARISNRIINEVRGVNRVVYDIYYKPPATIEWE